MPRPNAGIAFLQHTAHRSGLEIGPVTMDTDDLGLRVYDIEMPSAAFSSQNYRNFRSMIMRKHRQARVEHYPDSEKIQVDLLDEPDHYPVPRRPGGNEISTVESSAKLVVRMQEREDEYGHVWKWDGDVKKCTRCGKYLGTSSADAPCAPRVQRAAPPGRARRQGSLGMWRAGKEEIRKRRQNAESAAQLVAKLLEAPK